MKKIILSVFLLLVFVKVNSQDFNYNKNKNKNEVSLVFTDLINGALQLRYERFLDEHITVTLGLGYKGNNGLINLSGIDTEQLTTNDISYSGFKIIPEVRYYFNKENYSAMKGFYLGAFFKYSHYQTDLFGLFTNSEQEDIEVDIDADMNIASVGIMAGYKLPVSKTLSIDFLIAGPGAGFYNFSIFNTSDNLTNEFFEVLNENLSQYPIFEILDGNFNFTSDNRRANFNLLTFRYAISISYSF